MDANPRQPSAEGGMRSQGNMLNPGAPGPTASPNVSTEEARPGLTAGLGPEFSADTSQGVEEPPALSAPLASIVVCRLSALR